MSTRTSISAMKCFLLGSAAGFVALGGAQAADLPVKARPVEYVKICSLYGEGFYYIPGSDTCLKLGGYVRADYGWNVRGARTPHYKGDDGARDRTVAQYSTRHRANIQIDTRTQTGYGTLRTFTSVHFQNENGTFSQNVARAFIQWAGFTFGHAQSFSDTWDITDSWHYTQQQNSASTGANGVNQIAYSVELGNGATLTFGADEVRRKSLTNLSNPTALPLDDDPDSSYIGQRWPDPYVAFKVNQAWGYWATSFTAHDVAATYYNGDVFGPAGACILAGDGSPFTTCGHPGDKIGWAVQSGAELKMDFISPGDRLGFSAKYGQGHVSVAGGNNLDSASLFGSGNQAAIGWITDGVFVNGAGIELTTAWTVAAGYEHYWTPVFKTSFTGAYTQVLYNNTAKNYFAGNVCVDGGNVFIEGPASCDPNWSYFQGGVRTQWTPVRGLLLGVDIAYTRVFTAFKGATASFNDTLPGARPPGLYRIDDQGIWTGIFRAQRNFNAGD